MAFYFEKCVLTEQVGVSSHWSSDQPITGLTEQVGVHMSHQQVLRDKITNLYLLILLQSFFLLVEHMLIMLLIPQSFFLLVEHLPALRHLGILSEWLGLDRWQEASISACISTSPSQVTKEQERSKRTTLLVSNK